MPEKVEIHNIADICKTWNQICGANKNLYRSVPSMVDGLKPGARRLLYTMYKEYNKNSFAKVATIVGSTLKLHPHGDVAIADTLVAAAQSWNNSLPLIDGKGNFGSMMGDAHAAQRYPEAKMSEYAWDCFFKDFTDSNVDMRPSYDGRTVEPDVLPAKYPNALINGSLGIGYGLASNIPPYNFAEVMRATISLIKDPTANVYIVPDSPTGCLVVDDNNFASICNNGYGNYRMRGEVKISPQTNVVTIVSEPYQVASNNIKDKIIDLRESKVLPEVIDLKDRSNLKNGICIILTLKPDADPEKFVEKLYSKNTGLEKDYPVSIKLIDDFKDVDYTITSFLLEWIEYRRELKRTSFNFRLTKTLEAQQINDIMLFMLDKDNYEITMRILKSANNKADLAARIMSQYSSILRMSSLQANTIADMRMHEFTKEAHALYRQKKIDLTEELDKINDVLNNPSKIDDIIINELTDGIKKFGTARKSKIISLTEDTVPNTEHVICVTPSGLCKKVDISSDYVGRMNEAFIAIRAFNRQLMYSFDDKGIATRFSISDIPNMDNSDAGIPLSRYASSSKFGGDIIALQQFYDEYSDIDNHYLIFVTANGFAKKTPLSEIVGKKGSFVSIKVNDDDRLISVTHYTTHKGAKDLIIFTKNGIGTRVDIDDIPINSRTSMGFRRINVPEHDEIAGANKIIPSDEFVVYITRRGKLKLTELKYLPKQKKREQLMQLIDIGNDELIAIKSVSKNDDIAIFTRNAQTEIVSCNAIPVTTRIAQATKIVKNANNGNPVIGYKIISDLD